MSSLADRINSLRQRASEVTSQLTALADKRRSYSLAASEGDAKARKEIADVDFETDALRREEATVLSALEVGAALEQQRALEAEQAKQREREVEAYKLARGVIAHNEEIDLALKQLREAFERRQHLLAQLANTGLVDWQLTSRLASKAPGTRAACAAGLHKYLQVETVSPQAMLPLSDSNSLLLSIGTPDDNKPMPRASRANNGGS